MGNKKSGSKSSQSKSDFPQVYGIRRSNGRWKTDRRHFLTGAAAAAGAALGHPRTGKAAAYAVDSVTGAAKKKISCEGVNALGGVADCLVFSSDGSLFASAEGGGKLKLWSAPYWSLDKSIAASETVISALAVSPDGNWLVTGDWDGVLAVWSAKTRKLVKKIGGYWSQINGIAVTPDGKRIVTVGWESGLADRIKLWSLPDLGLVKSWGGYNPDYALTLSPDGQILATEGSRSKAITFWSMNAGEEGKEITSFGDTFGYSPPSVLAFSGNGQFIAAGEQMNASVRIYRVSDRQLVKSITAHAGGVKAIAFNKKGNMLATAGEDARQYAKVWTFPAGRLRRILGESEQEDKWATALAFDPKTNLLHVAYSNVIKIWNPGKGKHLQCLIDLDETLKSKYGRTYRYKAANGKRVKVTVPACACAPEMPGNAKCVCDTVAGKQEGGGCFVHVYYYPN